MNDGRSVFATALGCCAMRWRDGIPVGLALCVDEAETPLGREPSSIVEAMDAVRRYLDGEAIRLEDRAIDLTGGSAFQRRIWDALRRVPHGTTLTYGDLARRAGVPGAARAVGTAMARNPLPLFVPCHRVLPASGGLGAFSGGRGPGTKAWLLALEGAGPPQSRPFRCPPPQNPECPERGSAGPAVEGRAQSQCGRGLRLLPRSARSRSGQSVSGR